MHEMHIVKDLFADLLRIAEEQKATKVTKIYLRMGEYTEINEEIVRFFIEEKSKDTIIEGAEVEIEKSPTRELTLISFDCD
jgi:Zn finger protein HypA/HybF involved in hydrogenase expression